MTKNQLPPGQPSNLRSVVFAILIAIVLSFFGMIAVFALPLLTGH